MNLETFLRWLRRTREGHTWSEGKRLRSVSASSILHCPITAVCKEKTGKSYNPGGYRNAAFEIGLEFPLSAEIADAADCTPGCDIRLRARLRRAVGL